MRLLAGIICLFVFALPGFSQSDRGTITGTVSDPANAVVPNAPITARNTETGIVYNGATSATGNYTIIAVAAGTYDASCQFRYRGLREVHPPRFAGGGCCRNSYRHDAGGGRKFGIGHGHRSRAASQYRNRRSQAQRLFQDAGRFADSGAGIEPGRAAPGFAIQTRWCN